MTRPGGCLLVLSLVLSPGLCLSQTSVWFLDVTSPQPYVLAGAAIQLSARATSAAGAPVTDAGIEWRSSNPTIAEVDASGRVRGLFPGEAFIEAVHGNVTARAAIQVHPARIVIEPGGLDLESGSEARLSALALSASGTPIAGARFLWTSGLAAVAAVDGAGVVTARSEGSVTVTALLDVPDLGFGFTAQALVRVRPPLPYRPVRLGGDPPSRPVSIRRLDTQAASGDRTVFTAVLSTGGQALLLLDSAGLRPLAVAGNYFEPTGQVVTGFGNASMNASGDVVASLSFATWPHQRLIRFSATGSPAVLALPAEYGGLQVDLRSLGPTGELLFYGWNNRGQNLLWRRVDGQIDRLATQGDDLPGFGQVQWFYDLVASAPGRAFFVANRPGVLAVFEWDGARLRKLLATGEAMGGNTIEWIGPLIPNAAGDLFARMGGPGYNQVLRYSAGQWSRAFLTNQPSVNGISVHWTEAFYAVQGSSLLFSGGSDRGHGLFRSDGGNLEMVARSGQGADEWRWFEFASLDAQGRALVRGPSGSLVFRMARVGPEGAAALLESGRTVDLPAPAAPAPDLSGGVNAALPVLSAPGRGLFRADGGRLDPVLLPGDALPGGDTAVWLGATASSPSGDVAFHAGTLRGSAVYLRRSGLTTRVTQNWDQTQAAPGLLRWFDWPLGANDRGQVVMGATYESGQGPWRQGLFVFAEGAAPRTVALAGTPAPGGGSFGSFHQAAIDERGRVAFVADAGPGPWRLYYWDGSQARLLRRFDEGVPSSLNGRLEAAGDRIYALLSLGSPQEIYSYDGAAWRIVVPNAPYGICNQSFSPSPAGDVLYFACLSDGSNGLAVRKPDGRSLVVASTASRSADGDWFLQFLQANLSPQGDVFFTAITPLGLRERIGLFRATPR